MTFAAASNKSTSSADSDYTDSILANSYAIRSRYMGTQPISEKRFTTEIMAEIRSPEGRPIAIKTLLDTGTTRSIVLKDIANVNTKIVQTNKPIKWKTMAGNFSTDKVGLMTFRLPELSASKEITWPCHVDETQTKNNAAYDLVLGLDLINELKIVFDFERHTIRWGEHETEMQERETTAYPRTLQLVHQSSNDPKIIRAAEERQAGILDADYSKVEIDEHVNELEYLDPEQRKRLAQTLRGFPELFGGGLGRLKINPVHLELKAGAKPYHAKPFGIPQAYETTTKKDIARWEQLGIW